MTEIITVHFSQENNALHGPLLRVVVSWEDNNGVHEMHVTLKLTNGQLLGVVMYDHDVPMEID